MPAGRDLGREGKEGFINKLIAMLREKGGRGRGLEEQKLVPKKRKQQLVQWLKK